MTERLEEEIDRYLRTGEYDPSFAAWPGDVIVGARRAKADLKNALIAEVRRRTSGLPLQAAVADVDLVAFARDKLAPMVRGLFPGAEHRPVLGLLERSLVFLTAANVHDVLHNARWLHTTWDLANLYLGSVGTELLGPRARRLVGLSEETTCFVSNEYFKRGDRFADFVVHEAAHIFHNCKRRTIGLPDTRTREWLLPIDFRKRETFAYACEAYASIVELGDDPSSRRGLLGELSHGPMPSDERVNADEYLDILREAVEARNGWKRILRRCTPARPRLRVDRLGEPRPDVKRFDFSPVKERV